MSIQTDFAAYTNSLGFISNSPNGSSGNDLLITAEAALVQKKNGFLPPDYYSAVVAHAQITPGLYGRPGWMQDQEAADDMYGVDYISPVLAKAVADYGKSHFWYFKTSPNSTWYEPLFWRWPAVICHTKWAAGEKPNIFLRLWWAACVAFSGTATEEDPWKINRLLIEVAGDKGWLERIATKNYWKRLHSSWGTLKNCYNSYYGAEHPIVKYCTE